MPLIRVDVPFYLPKWLYQQIRRIKYALPNTNAHRLNLQGDRDVEWSFIAAHLPPGPGEALDFGCGGSYMSLIAARRGFHVLALDLEPQNFYWHHPNVRFLQGDLLRLDTPANSFHLVINCSSVEHVGLAGRFGVAQGSCDGDLQAMARLRSLLKQEGIMLLTIPCGRDHVFPPLHRVYGAKRLTRLLEGYALEKEGFWVKDSENRWTPCEKEIALNFEAAADLRHPSRSVYSLGCFVLRKNGPDAPASKGWLEAF